MPERCRRVAALVLMGGLLTGCGSELAPPPIPKQRPTEEQTRDAYFDTPVIVDEAASRAALGITRAKLTELMGGRAAIGYSRGRRRCVVYPINGTQVWDAFGSPQAAEWEFCFGPDGRLAAKRRLPVGS
jgi:hypothetical protein